MIKKIPFIIATGLLLVFHSQGQNSTPTIQSNYSLNFKNFLAGVKYAEVLTTPEQEQFMVDNPGAAEIYLGVTKYLETMGFDEVGFSAKFRGLSVPSLCDEAKILVNYNVSGGYINDLRITFYSCNGDYWIFKWDVSMMVNGLGAVSDKVYNAFQEMYGYNKPSNNNSYRYSLKGITTKWTEESLKEHFVNDGADPLEGIYENSVASMQMAKYRVALIKNDMGYDIIYLSGASNYADWKEGELKAKLSPTATPTLFKTKWYMQNKSPNEDAYITFEDGFMNLYLTLQGKQDKEVYIKLYPTANDHINVTNHLPASGTGFAIASNGLIATNHHVVSGASSIRVRGVNGNFSKSYSAKVLMGDKNNDLAIIKIDDSSFRSIGQIPYIITNKISNVGTSVFVLGYPLRATMGDEIKLTNGIISAKSGFQGDITSYQISAPVQPGNSGGPLFDSNGSLVGIINSKNLQAENAGYAIKSSYLLNLIQLLESAPKLSTMNLMSGKSLSDQVKKIQQFVYIIEVN